MSDKPFIPLHLLNDETSLGFYVQRMDAENIRDAQVMESHRDDHCNFFFQERGNTWFMVDFKEIQIIGRAVFCVLPGQVHRPISIQDSQGWFMATDMVALDEKYRTVIEEFVAEGKPVYINDRQAEKLYQCMKLLSEMTSDTDSVFFHPTVLRSMQQTCISMFTAIFQEDLQQNDPAQNLRPAIITRQFKSALLKNFKTSKSPSQYAEMLNISLSYLNEVVKGTTGKPVSHWIHQEILMEAKRLLYYTDMTVKQIAFSLGYDDHTYFSRLFTKNNQCSPGQFRSEYRE